MEPEPNVFEAERTFFGSLIEADLKGLDRLLADDFVLVDVFQGNEIVKASLLEAVGSGQVKFDAITAADNRVRVYGTTAVVHGRTHMTGRFVDAPYEVHSRYTHVYVMREGAWRLVSAQGTQITGASN
jgi:ketosteroid isomerase-like protein